MAETADEIVARCRKESKTRTVYHVTAEELLTLLQAGAVRQKLNHANGDGTYEHRVSYSDAEFLASSAERIV